MEQEIVTSQVRAFKCQRTRFSLWVLRVLRVSIEFSRIMALGGRRFPYRRSAPKSSVVHSLLRPASRPSCNPGTSRAACAAAGKLTPPPLPMHGYGHRLCPSAGLVAPVVFLQLLRETLHLLLRRQFGCRRGLVRRGGALDDDDDFGFGDADAADGARLQLQLSQLQLSRAQAPAPSRRRPLVGRSGPRREHPRDGRRRGRGEARALLEVRR